MATTTIPIEGLCIEGAVSLERGDGWVSPWRIRHEEKALFPSEGDRLVTHAHSANGVRLRFRTDSDRVSLVLDPVPGQEHPGRVDLCKGAEVVDSALVPPSARIVELSATGLPSARHKGQAPVYELWLPHDAPVRIRGIQIDGTCAVWTPTDSRPRWTAYGSSITMCRSAPSPARTWPAIAARISNTNLTNLGFAGECHLDSMVARTIRDTPADLITLKLGINVHGNSSLNRRSYPAAIVGMVKLIRERHPTTPIGVITSIYASSSELVPNAFGMTLRDYRSLTQDAVARLQALGDDRLLTFCGTDLLGEDESSLLADGTHPTSAGYELIGTRAADIVLPRLLEL